MTIEHDFRTVVSKNSLRGAVCTECTDGVKNVHQHNPTELQKYYAGEEDFLWMAAMYELKDFAKWCCTSKNSEMPVHRFLRVDRPSIVSRCPREWRKDIFLGLRGLYTYDRHPHRLPTILPLTASNVSTDIKYQLNLTGAGTGSHSFQWTAGVAIPVQCQTSITAH